jgi:hypothetical protein
MLTSRLESKKMLRPFPQNATSSPEISKSKSFLFNIPTAAFGRSETVAQLSAMIASDQRSAI